MSLLQNLKGVFNPFSSEKSKAKKLLNQLRTEHQVVLDLYHDISSSLLKDNLNGNDIESLQKSINIFVEALGKHIELEDDELYHKIFIGNTIPSVKDKIQEIQMEINPLIRSLEIFLKKHKKITNESKKHFKEDFDYLCQKLLKRIQYEENILYKYFEQKYIQ